MNEEQSEHVAKIFFSFQLGSAVSSIPAALVAGHSRGKRNGSIREANHHSKSKRDPLKPKEFVTKAPQTNSYHGAVSQLL